MNRRLAAWMAAAAVVLGLAMATIGQTQATNEKAAAEQAQPQNTTLWGMWKTGGWAMYPIGLLSVAAVALTIYGFIATREDKMIHMEMVPGLQDSVRNLDIATAISTCTGTPSTMTNILHAGLRRLSEESLEMESVEKAMEEAAVEENTVGMKPIGYISIIASVAPMFGLLGTVSGMIKAFQKIGLGGMGDPERLAADIGEAMITTAFGLIVGIPAMFFYFFLKARFATNMSRIGRVLGDLTHHMGTRLKGVAQPSRASEPAPAAARPTEPA